MRRRRELTGGEQKLARHVFGDTLNVRNVKVIEHFMKAGNLDDTAITPFGSIYFPADDFRADYIGNDIRNPIAAVPDPSNPFKQKHDDAHWFLHELAHVWQHYVGIRVGLRGAFVHAKPNPYVYGSSPAKPDLLDYNIEQQGDIICDYYAWELGWTVSTNNGLKLTAADYETRILRKFIEDPAYPRDKRRLRAWARGLDR